MLAWGWGPHNKDVGGLGLSGPSCQPAGKHRPCAEMSLPVLLASPVLETPVASLGPTCRPTQYLVQGWWPAVHRA